MSNNQNKPTPPEEMASFFNARADTYDSHMINDLSLDEFYGEIGALFAQKTPMRLLDLGCGTGLELDRLFICNPDMHVTGIDLSQGMLDLLMEKHGDKNMRLICESYFDADFGSGYDAAVSTYSLHHFPEAKKHGLYQKIYAALDDGGVFVFGDYTVAAMEMQIELSAAAERVRAECGIGEGVFLHYDTPFTAETEIRLLTSAGFRDINIIRQWESTTILTAYK